MKARSAITAAGMRRLRLRISDVASEFPKGVLGRNGKAVPWRGYVLNSERNIPLRHNSEHNALSIEVSACDSFGMIEAGVLTQIGDRD